MFTHEYAGPGAAAVAGHTQFGRVHGEGGQMLVDNTALAFHWKSQDHALKMNNAIMIKMDYRYCGNNIYGQEYVHTRVTSPCSYLILLFLLHSFCKCLC